MTALQRAACSVYSSNVRRAPVYDLSLVLKNVRPPSPITYHVSRITDRTFPAVLPVLPNHPFDSTPFDSIRLHSTQFDSIRFEIELQQPTINSERRDGAASKRRSRAAAALIDSLARSSSSSSSRPFFLRPSLTPTHSHTHSLVRLFTVSHLLTAHCSPTVNE